MGWPGLWAKGSARGCGHCGQSVLPAVRSDPITYMKFCLLLALVTPPCPVPVFPPINPVSTSCPSPALISGFPGGFTGPLLGNLVSPHPTPCQKYPIALGSHFCQWLLPATAPSLGPLLPPPLPHPLLSRSTRDECNHRSHSQTAQGAEVPAAGGRKSHPSDTPSFHLLWSKMVRPKGWSLKWSAT